MGPFVGNGGGRPGDAATTSDYASVGQEQFIAADLMLHRRLDPKDVLLIIAGGQYQWKGKTLLPSVLTPRTARGSNRFAGRPEYHGRRGNGDRAKSPNNQPDGIRKKTTHDLGMLGGGRLDLSPLSPAAARPCD